MLFGILPLQVGGMKHRNAKIQLPSGGVERVTATAFKLLQLKTDCCAMLCYANRPHLQYRYSRTQHYPSYWYRLKLRSRRILDRNLSKTTCVNMHTVK